MSRVSNRILRRVYILFGLFLFSTSIILLRVAGLQLNQSKWRQVEIEEKVFFHKVIADRGNIVSENGEIMATSLPFYRLGIDPTEIDTLAIPQFRDSLQELSRLLAMEFEDEYWDTLIFNDTLKIPYLRKDTLKYYNRIMDAMKDGDRHLYLSRKLLDFNELKKVKRWPILNLGRYKGGLAVEKIYNKRYYPYGDLARITLGILRHDTLGIRGIEAAYNDELRGTDGYILAQKVAGSSYIPLDKYGEEESVDGWDIHTTLDVDLQDIVEYELKRGVERFQANAGTAILLEVSTGKIKALANWPEEFNHGVASNIEPGSTFKLISAAAALEDTIIDINDTIDTGNGIISFGEWEIRDDAAYGEIPFIKVFARSSNVGFSKLISGAYQDNPERYIDYLKRFGFFETASSQFKGEPLPVVYQPGDSMWNSESMLPSMAYGYSIGVTPLQMATFYNAIANNGIRVKPWIVTEIRNNASVMQRFEPEVGSGPIVSQATISRLKTMMEEVVNNGTARYAFAGMPFQVAGKTGTVRKAKRGIYKREYRSSFGGFFPADNPRYTCYVMIDDPQGKRIGGGSVAAPVFREIAESVYNLDVKLAQFKPKTNTKPVSHPVNRYMYANRARTIYDSLQIATTELPETDWIKPKTNGHQVNLASYTPRENRIPNLRGMSARDALHLLEELGVQVILRGSGKVKRQNLQPGFFIGDNTVITLYLGT